MNAQTCHSSNGSEMQQARQRGHLHVQHEGFGRLGVDELAARRQDGLQRLHDEVEDVLDEEDRDAEADEDAAERPDEALTQLIQMLEERHLAADPFVLLVVIERARRRRGGGDRGQGHAGSVSGS